MKTKKLKFIIPALVLLAVISGFIYVKSVLAATNCWTGAGSTNNWSETANWSLGVSPGVSGNTTNLATFGGASCASGLTKDVTIDTNIDLSGTGGGILISATTNAYTGIITQGTSTVAIGSGNYSQASGTFTGGSGTIDLNGSYSLTGGTFTSTSGTMTISGSFTVSGSPTFTHNSGTVTFDGTTGGTLSCNNVTFNLVIISQSGSALTVNSNCNLPLGNNPTQTGWTGVILNGTLSGTGTLTISNAGGSITLNTGATLSGFSGLSVTNGAFNIAGATVDLGLYTTVNFDQNFTLSSGTFTAPSGTMTVAGNFTVSGGTFNANGGTFKHDGAGGTLSCNNIAFNLVIIADTANLLTINSNCTLPLGNNPTSTAFSITLNGTLSGTGTLTVNGAQGNLTMNSGAVLSGFTGLVVAGNFTVSGATVNFSNYTAVTIGGLTLSSGSLTAPPGNMNIGGSIAISGGTFSHNNGTITINGANNQNLNCGTASLNTVIVNRINGALVFTGNCTVGSFTLTNSNVNNPASPYTLSVTGNFTDNYNVVFGGANLTVAMTGSGSQTYTRSTGTFVSAFTVNKPSGTVTLANSLNTGTTSTGQACNITSGTLDLAGNALVCASLTVANGGNLQWRGSETITLTSPTTPTLNSGSTVTFTGTSGTNSYTIPTTWGNFSNLTINAPTGTNTFNLGADLTVGKNLTISAGTFDATASLYNVTIGGNFTQNGTMTARNNTFTFNDATQNSVITGTSGITFYNLTSTTPSKILKFGAGKTFRTNGALTITGTSKNPVNLISAAPTGASAEKFSNTGFNSNNTSWTVVAVPPSGWVEVPGNATYSTTNFLAMKYEAKCAATSDPATGLTSPTAGYNTYANNTTNCTAANSKQVVSVASGYPIANISQTNSITYCSGVTVGSTPAHLQTNNEWMTVARDGEAQAGNWTLGSVGSGYLFAGHNDNAPVKAGVASTTDTGDYRCAYTDTAGTTEAPSLCPTNTANNTSGTAGNQVRTLTLSNNAVIWDIPGNVWEWTNDTITEANQPDVTGQSGFDWREFTALTDYGSLSYDQIRPAGTTYNATYGVGRIYHNSNSVATTNYGFFRGGGWLNGLDAGAFELTLSYLPSYSFDYIGFRCASDPVAISESFSSTSGRSGAGGNTVTIGSVSDGKIYQSVNVGDASTYNISAYVYNNTAGSVGGTVDTNVAQLYYGGNTISSAAWTAVSGETGWYKLTGTVTGVASGVDAGVLVKAGKTVIVDDLSLAAASLSQPWTINLQGTSAISYAFIQDSACDGTSLAITLDSTSRNGGNNGTCWGGYPTNVNPHFNGSTYIRGNVRIGN